MIISNIYFYECMDRHDTPDPVRNSGVQNIINNIKGKKTIPICSKISKTIVHKLYSYLEFFQLECTVHVLIIMVRRFNSGSYQNPFVSFEVGDL